MTDIEDERQPIAVGFGNGEQPSTVYTVEELDAVLDDLDRRARADEPRIAIMTFGEMPGSALPVQSMSIGLGADLVPLTHEDERGIRDYHEYVHSVGDQGEGEPEEWAFLNTWNETPLSWLIPASRAREAARQWLLTGGRPANVVWDPD